MNLSSTHLAHLIQVLHEHLAELPDVAAGRTYSVVEWRGRIFGLRREEVDVLGPFETVFDLVTELGQAVGEDKDAEHPILWRWDARDFAVDHEQRTVERRGGVARPPSQRAVDALKGKTFMVGVTRPRDS